MSSSPRTRSKKEDSMRKLRLWMVIVVFALLGSLGVGGWLYAQTAKGRRAAMLSAQDSYEITQLYSTMYQGGDARDASSWLSTFAEDGVLKFPSGEEVVGKKALAEWRAKSFGGKVGDSKRRHSFPNIRLTPAPDGGALARAYFILIDASGKEPVLIESGTSDDVFVKTADGWKFKSHAVHVDARRAVAAN
jgi:hypothetical protein